MRSFTIIAAVTAVLSVSTTLSAQSVPAGPVSPVEVQSGLPSPSGITPDKPPEPQNKRPDESVPDFPTPYQDADPRETGNPETPVTTYIVTATPDAQDIYSVPAAVTVITADDIAASGKNSVTDILATVPGISFTEGFYGKSTSSIRMRGSSGDNPFGQTAVLVNGRRLSNPDMAPQNWASIPLTDIERIEVLDGSNGSLYGSGAVGGVINIILKNPVQGLSSDASLSYGSCNESAVRAELNYGTGSAGIRAYIDSYRTDGWREHTKSDWITAGAAGSIRIGRVTLNPSVSFFQTNFELAGGLTQDEFSSNPRQANADAVSSDDRGTERNTTVALDTRLDITGALRLDIPAAWTYKHREYDNYGFNTYFFHQIEANPSIVYEQVFPAVTLTARGGFDFSGTLYTGQSFSDRKRTTRTNEYTVRQFSYAPFAFVSAALPAGINLSAGTRYTAAPVSAEKAAAGVSDNDLYRAWVYDAAASWRFFRNASVYIKHGTLFRIPFIDEKTAMAYPGSASFNSGLRPETGWNVEGGIKYAFNPYIAVTGTVYHMVLENEIAYNTTTYQNENLDSTRRTGGFIAVESNPVSWLCLAGNISYVHAVSAAGENEGKQLPLNAAWNGYAAATVKLPQGITFGADTRITGSRYMSGDNSNTQDKLAPYVLLGLQLGWTPPQLDNMLTIRMVMDNVLDTSYATFATAATAYSQASYYPGTGRTFSIRGIFRY